MKVIEFHFQFNFFRFIMTSDKKSFLLCFQFFFSIKMPRGGNEKENFLSAPPLRENKMFDEKMPKQISFPSIFIHFPSSSSISDISLHVTHNLLRMLFIVNAVVLFFEFHVSFKRNKNSCTSTPITW